MAKVEKEAIISTPLPEVFNYISTPSNLLELWPSLMEIKDVQSLPNGGYSGRWGCKMLGMRFKGTAEYTQVVPNQWFAILHSENHHHPGIDNADEDNEKYPGDRTESYPQPAQHSNASRSY